MTDIELVYMCFIAIVVFVIWLEAHLGFQLGTYDGMVWCSVPPFLKRVRIFGYWIGFSPKWKFMYFKKETE